MNDESKQNATIKEILNGFGKLLVDHTVLLETKWIEAQKQTNNKLDTLVDSVNTLTINHIETKKDREHDNDRMERMENNQREMGETVKNLSETVLVINERQESTKESNNRNLIILGSIISGVVTVAIVTWWGLK